MEITQAGTVRNGTPLSKAIPLLEKNGIVILVDEKNCYLGELTAKTIARFDGDAENAKVENIARKERTLSEKDVEDEEGIAKFFSEEKRSTIAILDKKGKIKGTIGIETLIPAIEKAVKGSGKTVREMMGKVQAMNENENIGKAREMMEKGSAEEVTIIGNDGKLKGFVTAGTIAMKITPQLRKPFREGAAGHAQKMGMGKEKIGGVMESVGENGTVYPEEKIGSIIGKIKQMGNAENRSVIVVEDEKPIGILGISDLLSMLVETRTEGANIIVEGFKNTEEKMMKDSIIEECKRFLEKLNLDKSENAIKLHVKSARKGKDNTEYEVHGTLEIGGTNISCSTPEMREHRKNWDLSQTVNEVLDELRGRYLNEIKGAERKGKEKAEQEEA